MKKEETFKWVLIVVLLLILILGGYVYLDKIRVLDKTINQIQDIIPQEKVINVEANMLFNQKVLKSALTEEELKTNFSSIVKNIHGYDVEFKCEDYNDVDGCNNIEVIVKPFHIQ